MSDPRSTQPVSALSERAREKDRRARMLVGILEDLPRASDSTPLVHDEILRARLEADHARRLAARFDNQ